MLDAPAAPAATDRVCPLCGHGEAAAIERYSRAPWRVVACTSCGFVYLANPPGDAALEAEFAWEETMGAERARRLAEAPVLYGVDYATRGLRGLLRPDEARRYRRWFGEGGAVLDIGCGYGGRVGPPFVPFGIEVSRALAAEADRAMRAHGGACVQGAAADAIAAFDEGQFAGILMRSYLEHETRPLDVLRGAHRVLAPTGAVYVKVPNYGSLNRRVVGRNWCGFRHPDHVNYFRAASLAAMAAAAGFSMRVLNRANLALDDNIHALLRKA